MTFPRPSASVSWHTYKEPYIDKMHYKKSWRKSSTPCTDVTGTQYQGVEQSFRHPSRQFYNIYIELFDKLLHVKNFFDSAWRFFSDAKSLFVLYFLVLGRTHEGSTEEENNATTVTSSLIEIFTDQLGNRVVVIRGVLNRYFRSTWTVFRVCHVFRKKKKGGNDNNKW